MNRLRNLRELWRAERGYALRRPEPTSRPLVFSIETTSICNLRCVMCPHKDMTRDRVLISDTVFCTVVDEVSSYNGMLWLHNLGEPLAHPEFDRLVRYVKSRGLPCGFSTNAVLLDERRTNRLLASGLDTLILCLDGATRSTYERLRAGADFDQVITNIERFLQRKRELGARTPETVVQLIYMHDTESEVQAFRERWQGAADRVLIKAFSTWGGQSPAIAELAADRHRYAPGRATQPRHPCAYLWKSVVVTASGDVIPCCADFDASLVMGNVNQQSLAEIWQGERYRALRRAHLEGRYSGACANCLEWTGAPRQPLFPLGSQVLERLDARRRRGRSAAWNG
jgi:radical SAM protein with 4Fe4S-binding SPASM domain